MAETMTYDAGTDTITTSENLTPDEQDSLKVGEEMETQQENLLAGKYKNAQELEKAYAELESKLGEQQAAKSEETPTEEVSDSDSDELVPYLDDGSVNFEQVNEAYGEQLGEIFKNNNVDPWAISQHFHDNQGQITDAMYQQLEGAGLSRASIDSYLAGRAVESGYTTDSGAAADLTDSEVNSIKNSVGGEAQYQNMVNWASQNLPQTTVEAFDELINSGNAGAIQLAVNGLRQQYEETNGYEGRMLAGKAAQSSGDVFRSQPELVAAMEDPRYDKDPAYRQDVIEKLDRSNLNF